MSSARYPHGCFLTGNQLLGLEPETQNLPRHRAARDGSFSRKAFRLARRA